LVLGTELHDHAALEAQQGFLDRQDLLEQQRRLLGAFLDLGARDDDPAFLDARAVLLVGAREAADAHASLRVVPPEAAHLAAGAPLRPLGTAGAAPNRSPCPALRSAALRAPSESATSSAARTAPRLWPWPSNVPPLISASHVTLPASIGSSSPHSSCSVGCACL